MDEEKAVNNVDANADETPVYTPKRIGTREEMLDACESIGKQVGRYCHQRKTNSFLYDLRRCKRYERFLEVLDRFKSKIPNLGTNKEFLTYLDGHKSEWREYKSFISIFAKNHISSIEYAQSKRKENENVSS